MTPPPKTILIVDDDPLVRQAISRLLRSEGYAVELFASAEQFLANPIHPAAGCALLDLALPKINGLELQKILRNQNNLLPIVFLSGRADIPDCAAAMKSGAIDFLTKPVNAEDLLAALARALTQGETATTQHAELQSIETRLQSLTPRESQVLHYVVTGHLNKQTAQILGTVEKTIKVHRARIMEKMQAHSLADLVRMVDRLGITPQIPPNPLA
jgi:FixJ family two-component response regulator